MKFLDSLRRPKFTLSANNKEYEPLRLGNYFRLDALKKKFRMAILNKNKSDFRESLLAIVELQAGEKISNPNFLKLIKSFVEIVNNNHIDSETVFLRPPPVDKTATKSDTKKVRWDFEGRNLAQWIDHFAINYGWSLEEILNLDIITAAYLYQEILVREQFEKEWNYSLTEMAYSTDGNGKSRYVPLVRPYWMQDTIDGVIKTTKIRKEMLPQGNVIDLSGMGVMADNNELPPKIVSEETQTETN